LKDWQKRWEIFSDKGCGFIWYGVDSEGNVAEFSCQESFIPEVFFQDVSANIRLKEFFDKLPEKTALKLPENLRKEIKENLQRINSWGNTPQRGLFIFSEPSDKAWYDNGCFKQYIHSKNPYELLAIPNHGVNVADLPLEIQELLKPYHFENLQFADCQFLDVSKYLYCEV
jgi:hypothetical protein